MYISIKGQQRKITYLNAKKRRVLVEVPINLQHKNDQIIKLFNRKIKEYVDKFSASTLKSSDILFSYQYYWQLSLKYLIPILSFAKDMNILAKLDTKLLPKLRVIKMFLLVMRSTPFLYKRPKSTIYRS